MLACPRLVLAAAIAASPVTPTQAAGTCPNERADAGADANLGNCLGDAREARRASEPRLAAAAYARALMFAREAYAAGKQGPRRTGTPRRASRSCTTGRRAARSRRT
ncbi:hypothetical protein [Nannocystis pusilla]|uniref:hypothetical protein n=1 Tax=Nannocystis pusilla TaxID=889268 RepID=UPI003B77CCFE